MFENQSGSSCSLHILKMLYSEYKSHIAMKVVVSIVPGGEFTFISFAFPGSISDKSIIVIMIDPGFPIAEYLSPLNIKLIIPSFLKGRDQLSENDVVFESKNCTEKNPCRTHDTEP